LASRDADVAHAYRSALEISVDPQQIKDGQSAWGYQIESCGADRQCLSQSLDERLAAIQYAVRQSEAEPVQTPKSPVKWADAGPAPQAAPDTPASIQTNLIEEPDAIDEPAVETFVAPEAEQVAASVPSPSKPRRQVGGTATLAIGAMFILPVLAVVASLLVVRSLANHTMNRYGWPLILNWWNVLYLVGFFGGCFVASMGAQTGDALSLGFGFFGAIWLVLLIVNVRKTNLMTGLAMTLIQPFVVFILWALYGAAKAKMEGRRI